MPARPKADRFADERRGPGLRGYGTELGTCTLLELSRLLPLCFPANEEVPYFLANYLKSLALPTGRRAGPQNPL